MQAGRALGKIELESGQASPLHSPVAESWAFSCVPAGLAPTISETTHRGFALSASVKGDVCSESPRCRGRS